MKMCGPCKPIIKDTTKNLEEVVTDTISGFDRFNKYNLSASIGTTLYGTFNFGEDKKIQAIRHVMRPSLSYGYAPSFEQFYDEYIDGAGTWFNLHDSKTRSMVRLV